ncbi:MAG: hypothetical protein ACREX8_17480 [Gammaproteobacteria bacterium]
MTETEAWLDRLGAAADAGDAGELLHELLDRGWAPYCFGLRDEPDALAAVYRCPAWADVVVWRGPDQAAAYRVLVRPNDDPLTAEWVVWHYVSDTVHTLHAVLTLRPEATATKPYLIPKACRIPEARRRPWTMRPGCPIRLSVRGSQ